MSSVIAHHDTILKQQIRTRGDRTSHTGNGVPAGYEAGQPVSSDPKTQRRFAVEPHAGDRHGSWSFGSAGRTCTLLSLRHGPANAER